MEENGEAPVESSLPREGNAGAGRDAGGRWANGNQGARRHGLRAGSRHEFRKRDERTSRLLSKYLTYRAATGREIGATVLPLARRYVELTIMAQDLYAAWSLSPRNSKLHAQYISTTRALSLVAAQLGESATTARRFKTDFDNGNGLAAQLARYRLTAPRENGS